MMKDRNMFRAGAIIVVCVVLLALLNPAKMAGRVAADFKKEYNKAMADTAKKDTIK